MSVPLLVNYSVRVASHGMAASTASAFDGPAWNFFFCHAAAILSPPKSRLALQHIILLWFFFV